MTCAELEILLSDYVDGTLAGERKAEVEGHLAACAACAEFARDAAGAVAFIGRVSAVEPPPELMTRILFEVRAGKAPSGKKGWVRRLFGGVLDPLLQPRFVMGMAMTILSFSMLGRFAGVPVRQLKASDLDPAKIWTAAEHKVNRGWLAAVKYYESLRFVYEVQSRLREWSEQDEQEDIGTAAGSDESGSPPLIDSNDRRLRDYGQPAGSSPEPANKATERPSQ